MVHEEIYKGYKIKIFQDESPFDPRENDNLGKMHCFYKDYIIGDKKPDGMTPDKLLKIINKPNIVKLPIYSYEHSGLWISSSRNYPFDCPWDSSFIGYIYCSKKDIQLNFKIRKVTPDYIEKTINIFEAEIKEYNDYISGNCYGYVIEDENANEIESIWGFIGDYDTNCLVEARGYIDNATDIQLQLPLEG